MGVEALLPHQPETGLGKVVEDRLAFFFPPPPVGDV